MGGGNSSPVSIQNDGINVSGSYSGKSNTTISNITSGPTSGTQSATSKGSKTGVTVNATVTPVPGLLMNLNIWDTIKKDAAKAGHEIVDGAEWCYSNPTCKANAEKYGLEAAKLIYSKMHHKSTTTTTLQNLNLWDSIKSDAEKAGTALLHGAEWCANNTTCKANAEKYGTQAALAIANKVEGKTVLLIL